MEQSESLLSDWLAIIIISSNIIMINMQWQPSILLQESFLFSTSTKRLLIAYNVLGSNILKQKLTILAGMTKQ